MHAEEEGHVVYGTPILLVSKSACVLIRKGWEVSRSVVRGRTTSLYTTQSTFFVLSPASVGSSNFTKKEYRLVVSLAQRALK